MEVDTSSAARKRREESAARYRPSKVRLLLVAEAPPCTLSRYFYFEEVLEQDSLFRYVCKGVLGHVSAREDKAKDLMALRDAGVFLIDANPEPIPDKAKVRISPQALRALPARCGDLSPASVILIKSNVYDLAYQPLTDAGLNVVNVRMPFPGSGQQRRFEELFGQALVLAKFASRTLPA